MSIQPVILFGAGGLAKELCGYMDAQFSWHSIVCIVAPGSETDLMFGHRVYPDLNDVDVTDDDVKFVLAVAAPQVKQTIVQANWKHRDRWITYTHETAVVSPYAVVGRGSVIAPGAIVCADAKLGEFCFLNTNATIGHDSTLGDYSTLFPNSEICGNCNVGAEAIFGWGSCLLPECNLAAAMRVSAGAIVRASFDKPGRLLAGNPAMILDGK